MSSPLVWLGSFLGELRRRGVHRAAAAYGAAVFVLLQAADLLMPALPISEAAYRALALACLAAFPAVLVLAWIFDVTGGRLLRTGAATDAGPDVAAGHVRMLSVLVLAGVTVSVASWLGFRAVWADGDPDRSVVAIFPFRTAGLDVLHWSEGMPDLLTTVVDGAEGVVIADPWSLWRQLRRGENEATLSPDPEQAAQLSRRSRAGRFLLGSIIDSGDSVTVNARLYDARAGRSMAAFSVTGTVDGMAALVRALAVQLIAYTAPAHVHLAPGAVGGALTTSPEALKAYVMARSAARRGMVDSAHAAIRQAVEHDSTFALALVEMVGITSMLQFTTGQPFQDLQVLIERANAHRGRLRERDVHRLDAMAASVRTDGRAAATALGAILQRDSTDLHAWSLLGYVRNVYGWQFGATEHDAIAATERTLQLDSAHVPALYARAWHAVALGDTAAFPRILRLLSADSSGALTRANLLCLRAVTMPEGELRALAADAVRIDRMAVIAAYRCLRTTNADRAALLLDELRSTPDPWLQEFGRGEAMRLAVARGASAGVLEDLARGAYEPALAFRARTLLATASLAGVLDAGVASAAVADLHALVPPDSALRFFNERPVWLVGWIVGSHHAQWGDTLLARRWWSVIDSFPAGGSPAAWGTGLREDIASRLAMRRGDVAAAIGHARRALEAWDIHTENQPETMPEPHMRLHLAMLLKTVGRQDEARPLLQSLVPPTTWMGYLTARAAFELALIAEQDGRAGDAGRYYAMAWDLWRGGDAGIEPWRTQAEQGLTRALAQ